MVLTSVAADPQESTAAAAAVSRFLECEHSTSLSGEVSIYCAFAKLTLVKLCACMFISVLVRERIGKNIICKQNIPWYKEGLEKIFMCKLYSE